MTVRENPFVGLRPFEAEDALYYFGRGEQSQALLNRLREKVKKEKLREGDGAYDLLVLLETDGSKGIHNPELYEKLIQEALK